MRHEDRGSMTMQVLSRIKLAARNFQRRKNLSGGEESESVGRGTDGGVLDVVKAEEEERRQMALFQQKTQKAFGARASLAGAAFIGSAVAQSTRQQATVGEERHAGEKVTAAAVLQLIVKELPALEREVFVIAIKPLLLAVDMDDDAALDYEEFSDLVALISPNVSSRQVHMYVL